MRCNPAISLLQDQVTSAAAHCKHVEKELVKTQVIVDQVRAELVKARSREAAFRKSLAILKAHRTRRSLS